MYYVGDTLISFTIGAATMSDPSCDSSLTYSMTLSSGVAITTPPYAFDTTTRAFSISTVSPSLTGT